MKFELIPPRTAIPKKSESQFALQQDYWNDFGYRTQYHLYYLGITEKPEQTLIGTVKILKAGQKDTMDFQVNESFDDLTEDFISVGQSIDYYQRASTLPVEMRNILFKSLKDYLHFPALGEKFKSEPGWSKSLFRDFSEHDNMLDMARSLLKSKNHISSDTGETLNFTFSVTGWKNSLNFNFSNDDPIGTALPPKHNHFETLNHQSDILPSRIIAIIGRNGCGKSTLLARLARVAHATPRNRLTPISQSLGEIIPKSIGFTRIVTVSYSAFDSFRLPGIKPRSSDEPDERIQIIKDVENGDGRFAFCGLRDIAAELKLQIESESLDSESSPERLSSTLLKPIETLADEFEKTIISLSSNGKSDTFDEALNCIARDPSFSLEEGTITTQYLIDNEPRSLFLGWSTGHKIVMQILASIAARATKSSLILVDEPETHLHPPLLAALMHAIRAILNKEKAFAIIATHSPIVLQETLVKNVYLIRREGSSTEIFKPLMETFGANISELTGEVFGLNTETTDFYKILDSLIDNFSNLNSIEALFRPYGLSLQARAYVMSCIAKKGV